MRTTFLKLAWRTTQFVSATLVVLTVAASGQSRRSTTPGFTNLPGIVARQMAALGNRVQIPGKEQTVYIGELLNADGKRGAAQVVHQLPMLVRLDGFSSGALMFDGERMTGVATKNDEATLEVFTMDLAEGMFAALRNSASLRHLGNRFGPDSRSAPAYNGPRYDIYSTTGPAMNLRGQVMRSRLYYFDSDSGLLQLTRYSDDTRTPPVPVETRFSEWRMVEGSAYPGRIEHYRDGKRVFSFIANAVTPARPVNPERFR
jgi:hypothetical protein